MTEGDQLVMHVASMVHWQSHQLGNGIVSSQYERTVDTHQLEYGADCGTEVCGNQAESESAVQLFTPPLEICAAPILSYKSTGFFARFVLYLIVVGDEPRNQFCFRIESTPLVETLYQIQISDLFICFNARILKR